MGGCSRIRATGEERALLAVLARSGERGEADRARAVLLSLDGWSSAAIGRALRVRADTARAWRSAFARGGAEALRARPRPGRPGGQGIAALACAGAILADPGRAWRGDLDAAAAQGGDRPARRGRHLDLAPQPAAATKGGFAWRRPRHTLKGRQDRDAVERSGVRLRLLRQQAAAGDIRLLFGDEAEALTHPYLAHAWAKRGADLRIEAPGQARRRALLERFAHQSGAG